MIGSILNIPPELLELILSYLPHDSRLRASLVCSRFRDLLQPMIFTSITLELPPQCQYASDDIYGFGLNLRDMQRQLTSSRAALLAKSVRVLYIQPLPYVHRTMHLKDFPDLPPAMGHILSASENLVSLRLQGIHLQLEAFEILSSIPRLSELHLVSVTTDLAMLMDVDTDDDTESRHNNSVALVDGLTFLQLRLKTICIAGLLEEEFYILCTKILDRSHLRDLFVADHPTSHYIARVISPTFPYLRSLHFNASGFTCYDDVDVEGSLLIQAPTLEELRIFGMFCDESELNRALKLLAYSDEAFQNLKILAGPEEFVIPFLMSRTSPVAHLVIACNPDNREMNQNRVKRLGALVEKWAERIESLHYIIDSLDAIELLRQISKLSRLRLLGLDVAQLRRSPTIGRAEPIAILDELMEEARPKFRFPATLEHFAVYSETLDVEAARIRTEEFFEGIKCISHCRRLRYIRLSNEEDSFSWDPIAQVERKHKSVVERQRDYIGLASLVSHTMLITL
ncbi:hypothetical protein FA15DRAFT_754398 [Coprinopsis marcescibilis]|uniref:F-box domain-containing protein n=1 Tax=Coprinopsis marcescibilis TaxID=230819 RepID=A0A5C3L3G7_COPMA|nr:hypothetical protein FA15DRAFT_754398 [Coprinopsis marcescibilis]